MLKYIVKFLKWISLFCLIAIWIWVIVSSISFQIANPELTQTQLWLEPENHLVLKTIGVFVSFIAYFGFVAWDNFLGS